MERTFSIVWRNRGHWDIYNQDGRIFCLRGEPGAFFIRDERTNNGPRRDGFTTVDAAMAWVCSTLMWEDKE